jgi:hypothetical protein
MQGQYWFFFGKSIIIIIFIFYYQSLLSIRGLKHYAFLDCGVLYTDICYVFILIRFICIVIFDPSQLLLLLCIDYFLLLCIDSSDLS